MGQAGKHRGHLHDLGAVPFSKERTLQRSLAKRFSSEAMWGSTCSAPPIPKIGVQIPMHKNIVTITL